MKNALSIDLEDWFCVYNLSGVIKREDWEKCEFRVGESTERLLLLLKKHNIQATFFVLGWVAEKAPQLIQRIRDEGHEIACHTYSHLLLTQVNPVEFEDDLVKALEVLRRNGIENVLGFRAPSFTLVKETKWVLDILEKYGFRYDSSVVPIGFHPEYGLPDAPLAPYKITQKLYEVPLSCVEIGGKRIPICGGAYFRFFPYWFIRWGIKKCHEEGRPVVFYFHPWEIDPGQPRVKLRVDKYFRHYYNLRKNEKKLMKLLQDFEFTSIKELLGI